MVLDVMLMPSRRGAGLWPGGDLCVTALGSLTSPRHRSSKSSTSDQLPAVIRFPVTELGHSETVIHGNLPRTRVTAAVLLGEL